MTPSIRRWVGWLGGRALRAWLATLRVELAPAHGLDARDARPWVLAFWHGEQMPLLAWKRRTGRRTYALVSLSRDGDLQSGALGALGLGIERGSSSRGGARGLRTLERRLAEGHDAAFAVDGPRGPLHCVHEGAIAAARRGGALLVPIGAAVDRSRLLDRTWDQYRIPLPFARVVIALGPGLEPDRAGRDELGAAIDAAHRRAAEILALHDRRAHALTA